jgi:XTP/dITP diphosphohydrolase
MEIIFASNNDHKLREISSIIDSSIKLLSLKDININDDIPEEEPHLEGNALAKARYVHRITGMNVFADDTGLEVDALGGLPGVKSARFAGDGRDFSANIDKLLLMLGSDKNRKAQFRTVIALIWDNKEYLFEGIVEGKIISERRGTGGFGYDPIFIPDGKSSTFAEMPLTEKNKVSHRARALEKLKTFLSRVNIPDNKPE